MGRLKLMLHFMLFLSVFSMGKSEYESISDDKKIVPDELVNLLITKYPEFENSRWPENLGKKAVEKKDIPDEVLKDSEKWIKAILKAQWLPANITVLSKGIEKMKPVKADFLCVRYKKDGTSIQIQEEGVGLSILIDPNSRNENKDIEKLIVESLYDYFNFPSSFKERIKIFRETVSYKGNVISYGVIDCDFDINRQENWKKRMWWSHSFFWTDSNLLYFDFVECDGEGKTKPAYPRAKPGFDKRFKTEKPSGK